MRISRKSWIISGLATVLCACSQSAPAPDPAPEPAPDTETRAWPYGAMVAAADPRAVQAGLDVIAQGGHAVDAAIAVHTVLGLVEPQSSGIGGGGFMVVYDRASDQLTVYDGRETAPAAATPELFIKDGAVMDFLPAWQSGRSVGVPGAVALYKAAHDDFGQVDWARLFAPRALAMCWPRASCAAPCAWTIPARPRRPISIPAASPSPSAQPCAIRPMARH